MKLLIKGMVCNRCVYVVGQELAALGLEVADIRLGRVEIKKDNNPVLDLPAIRTMLQKNGFDLLTDRNQALVDRIKELVEEGVAMQFESGSPVKFSSLISSRLHKQYDTLSAIFSATEKSTLEKFIILKKIEKVKELLTSTDLSLTAIAYSFGYSSPAHLSSQLKKYSGFTATHYKQVRQSNSSADPQAACPPA